MSGGSLIDKSNRRYANMKNCCLICKKLDTMIKAEKKLLDIEYDNLSHFTKLEDKMKQANDIAVTLTRINILEQLQNTKEAGSS